MIDKLTSKQEKFCEEYMIDLNATEASIRAGYSKNTAAEIGCENLTKPHIQKRITKLKQKVSDRNEVTVDMVLGELKKIAFGDPRKLMEWNGDVVTIKCSKDLTDDEISMVGGIIQKKSKFGDTVEVKLNDKAGALDKIMRHIGGYDKDTLKVINEHKMSDENKQILKRLGITINDKPNKQ